MSNHPTSPLSCDSFVWHQSTKGNCHTCRVERGSHVGGYVSTRPSDPAFDAYLSLPCDDCSATATHNQSGRKVCNQHLNRDAPAFARND